jgi:hypothetical protein
MCVVRNFSQLEEAVRQDAREVLIMGQLASRLKQAIKEPDDFVRNDDPYRPILKQIQTSYTIRIRNGSYCVPVVLQLAGDGPVCLECGDSHGN